MAAYPQSVAYTRVFYAYLSSDHVSAATGKTITVNISKAGAAFGAAGGTVTEIANGAYKVALNTTDTNTIGDLAFYCTATGTDDIKFVDQVTDPAKGLGAPSNLDAAVSAVKTQTDKMTFSVANQIDSNVLDWKSATAPAMTGDAFARLGAPVGASISADIAGVPTTVWAAVMTGTTTAIQAMRGFIAALLGKASGLDLNAPIYRNIADTKNVISATTDANGNRSAVTLDLT